MKNFKTQNVSSEWRKLVFLLHQNMMRLPVFPLLRMFLKKNKSDLTDNLLHVKTMWIIMQSTAASSFRARSQNHGHNWDSNLWLLAHSNLLKLTLSHNQACWSAENHAECPLSSLSSYIQMLASKIMTCAAWRISPQTPHSLMYYRQWGLDLCFFLFFSLQPTWATWPQITPSNKKKKKGSRLLFHANPHTTFHCLFSF